MLHFDDTEAAFEYQSKKDLRKAYLLFSLLKFPFLVQLGSFITIAAFKLGLPVKGLVKSTIFQQFCGGESIQESESRINQLAKYRVGTILDYSVEGKENEGDFENTKEEIVKTIIKAAENNHIPFSVFKVTGLGPSSIIKKVNNKDALSEEEKEVVSKIRHRVNHICNMAY